MIVSHVVGTLGNNDWYVSNVNVSWDVTDPESGIASSSGCSSARLTSDTVGVTVTCTATNGAGLSASRQTTVKIDQTPPLISLTPSVSTLWPPNGKLVADTITGTITDVLSGVDPSTVTFKVIDSYGVVQPSGAVSISPTGQFSFIVNLEANRRGQDLAGRQYQIAVSASDKAGNHTSATATVLVPHDQGR